MKKKREANKQKCTILSHTESTPISANTVKVSDEELKGALANLILSIDSKGAGGEAVEQVDEENEQVDTDETTETQGLERGEQELLG